MTAIPFYLASRPSQLQSSLKVHDKFSGDVVAEVALADRPTVEASIAAAVEVMPAMVALAGYQRQRVLQHVVDSLQKRFEEFAQIMCAEAGKPIKDARGEVMRAIDTFRIAAEEAVRIDGEYLPLEISQRAAGYEGIVKRVAIGPCAFITPFNFPLNLVAHKVAPAIAMGCPFILKPAPQTPMSALMLGEILSQSELPQGAFSILPCEVDDALPLIKDDRIRLLSFTGSSAVGWMLKQRAGKKKVVLELGGNAACIVDRDADLELAANRITFGAFYQSGQSCISVQRLIVHEQVYDEIKSRLIKHASKLHWGDPRDERTFLGPLISEKDVQRVDEWVNEAVRSGAVVLCGGEPIDSRFYPATIVEHVPRTARLFCEEVFGPVLILERFVEFDDALKSVNASRYGLQAGVFTRDLAHAMKAWNQIEAGAVIINDVPSMRIDSMPYGGVKDSGLGREGVRYAMHEMSELRMLVLKNIGW